MNYKIKKRRSKRSSTQKERREKIYYIIVKLALSANLLGKEKPSVKACLGSYNTWKRGRH